VCAAQWLVDGAGGYAVCPAFKHESVVAQVADDCISVPVLDGEYGHPVGFGRSFASGLMALSGDRGAKPLFAQGRVVEVSVDDPGVLWDVDVPESLIFKCKDPRRRFPCGSASLLAMAVDQSASMLNEVRFDENVLLSRAGSLLQGTAVMFIRET
jgi:hypothetical protein